MKSAQSKIRQLGFEDLYILNFLGMEFSITEVAKQLNLTQPAVTQRLRKIEDVLGEALYQKSGRGIQLTREGIAYCQRATDVLKIIEKDWAREDQDTVIRVGTRPEAGRSWLWPAIKNLRAKHPQTTFHVHFGSGEEILAQLGIGRLDVVLSSVPLTARQYKAIELQEEGYSFVAAPKIAKQIKNFSDLKNHVLIEHDRSFPFMRYVDPKKKPKLVYQDVWFLESTEIMTQALVAGHGIGIIPEYLARSYVAKKKLARIGLNLGIASDYFKLIYRANPLIEDGIQTLADELVRIGLQ